MPALGHKDIKDVLLVTHRALGCLNIGEMFREVLSCLEIIFKADKSAFILADSSGNAFNYHDGMIYRGFDNAFNERYLSYYKHLDPHNRLGLRLPPVVTIDELIPSKEYVRSEIYTGQIRPQSMHYLMNMTFKSGGRLLGRLLLSRPPHANNFSSQEKAKADLMVPHLSAILHEKLILRQSEENNKLLKSLIVTIPHRGIMVLDETFQAMYIDKKAMKVLSDRGLTEYGKGGSNLSLPEAFYRACERLSKRAAENPRIAEERLSLEFNSAKQPLPILLRLVKPAHKPQRFLVCLYPEYSSMPFHQRLRSFGLTNREQEIASLICEGLENQVIADKLHISIFTLLAHLRSMFKKLAVNSRSSLTYRLLSL
jgi:DNA-binding CsgD family transcriptional regulator